MPEMERTSDLYRTNIYLSRKQREKLEAYASSKGVAVSEIVRRSIDFFLDLDADDDVIRDPRPGTLARHIQRIEKELAALKRYGQLEVEADAE